jgi:choline dehydrogenase-like flavoprotein
MLPSKFNRRITRMANVNPSLTIIANAIRIADRLLADRLK